MASAFVTGPCHVYIGDLPKDYRGAILRPRYLGTCQTHPEVKLRPQVSPVPGNCLMGTKVPIDVSVVGEDAIIDLRLTRWNQLVLTTVRRRAEGLFTNPLFPGSWDPGAMGTLAVAERRAWSLWLRFPYVEKSKFLDEGSMPRGYFFPRVTCVEPESLGPLSTVARIEQLILWAVPHYDSESGRTTLYSHEEHHFLNLPQPD